MSKLGKRLIQAAQEMNAIAKGEADPSTYRVHVPTRDANGRWFMREATLEEKQAASWRSRL